MNTPYNHSQRPPYQRENIDLALKIVLQIMSELGVDNKDYNPDKIRQVDSQGDFGGIHRGNNKIEIDERFRFNQSVYIHEILHGYSTSHSIKKNGKLIFRSGYQKHSGSNSGFNEGLTDILTLYGIRDNLKEVQQLRNKFRTLMHEFGDLAQKGGDPKYKSYTYGCENTGWYRSYFREMRLVDVIIDYVAYKRCGQKLDCLEDQQHIIFEDLVAGYFMGEFDVLNSLLNEADSSGKLRSQIKTLESGDILGKKITDTIRTQIKDIFNPNYRMDSIPTKLS